MDRSNIGMIQGRKQFCIALKSSDTISGFRKFLRQDLYRHIPAKNLVFSPKYFAHTTFAELICDLVMPERFANHEEALHVDSRCNAVNDFIGRPYCCQIG
jgi:hypothetical protein